MANTIKDSGTRREFSTGAVRDIEAGKGRMDLLPWAGIIEVSKHCENGALKYGEHNVDKGIPVHSLCDSAARHLAKYISGQTDEDHLVAAAWNLLFALEMREKHPELVDIPWNKDAYNGEFFYEWFERKANSEELKKKQEDDDIKDIRKKIDEAGEPECTKELRPTLADISKELNDLVTLMQSLW